MSKTVELSVIVLCYRSEENIIPFVRDLKIELATLTDRWELILVGNYLAQTADRTGEIVQQLAFLDSRVHAVVEPKCGMMGWDMRKGLQAAGGVYLCVIDGDGQFPIQAVAKCFRMIKSGRLDLVKTFRATRFDGRYRTLISFVYNTIFALLFPGLGSRDVNSKPKILRRKAYDKMHLTSDDWFIDAEIMINVRRHRMKFSEFPIEFQDLKTRPSFINTRALLEFMRNLVWYRLKEFFIKK